MSLQPNWSQASVSEGALYLQESSDGRQIAPSDIAQGQYPDCFFLAALGEIALRDPAYIANRLIEDDGGGNFSVNLFNHADGSAITDYGQYYQGSRTPKERFSAEPFGVNVNDFGADAVNNYNTSDILGGVKEIWPQVVEQAYKTDIGGFDPNGGYSNAALETLTGHQAYYQPTSEITAVELKNLDRSGALMMFGTDPGGSLPYNLLSSHEYMYAGMEVRGHQAFVDLINPWGNTQPDPIPFSQLSALLPTFDHGSI